MPVLHLEKIVSAFLQIFQLMLGQKFEITLVATLIDFKNWYYLRKCTPLKKKICRHQWHANTINKVDISGEQQSWYFCTFFMAKHLLI